MAEGDAAAVTVTEKVQACCRSEVHSSVLFAALTVAAPASGEAEIPRMVLEGEVIQNEAGVLLNEESEFIYIGGDIFFFFFKKMSYFQHADKITYLYFSSSTDFKNLNIEFTN